MRRWREERGGQKFNSAACVAAINLKQAVIQWIRLAGKVWGVAFQRLLKMMVILRWVSQLPQSSVHVIPRVFDGGQIQLVKDLAGHWSVKWCICHGHTCSWACKIKSNTIRFFVTDSVDAFFNLFYRFLYRVVSEIKFGIPRKMNAVTHTLFEHLKFKLWCYFIPWIYDENFLSRRQKEREGGRKKNKDNKKHINDVWDAA